MQTDKVYMKLLKVVLLSTAILFCFCQKKSDETKAFAKVGWNVISQDSFKAFRMMKNMFPENIRMKKYPGRRPLYTLCVETEAIYKKAKSGTSAYKKTDDWKWKETYFPAQMYLREVIHENWGFLNSEIERYYNEHKGSYIKVTKVPKDSSSKDSTRDSVTQSPLKDVKEIIAKTLFLKKYPIDSTYYANAKDSADSIIDTVKIKNKRLNEIKRTLPDFYMKEIYKKRYGSEYPDSIDKIYGEGKIISPKDMDVVLKWLKVTDNEKYKTPEKVRNLVEWLLKWKLFYDEAKEKGYMKKKEIKLISKWGWKFQVVMTFVNEKLYKDAQKNIDVDTLMCIYEYWDRMAKPGKFPDSLTVKGLVETNRNSKTWYRLYELIYNIRKKVGVTFLQSDYTDEKSNDPEKMASEADSLYGAVKTKEAESIYRKLINNFPFSPYGQNAYVELAKILTEKENYQSAVKNYRQFLLFSPDKTKRYNIFFMIGFVYSEHLKKPEHAEVNYKWILKNEPECDLADDAEFMCLHLDEPMIGVEELRAEAKRQGRTVEEVKPVLKAEDKAATKS